MRYLIGFFVAAVLTAAVLRHFLHVQVGFTREEIRRGSDNRRRRHIFQRNRLPVEASVRPFRADLGLLVFHHYRNSWNMLAPDTRQYGLRLSLHAMDLNNLHRVIL